MPTDKTPSRSVRPATDPYAGLGAWERLDRRIFGFIYWKTRNRAFEFLMPFMSQLANRGFIQIVLGIPMLLIGAETRRAALMMWACTVAAGFVAELTVKKVWRRQRPFMVLEGVHAKVPSRRLIRRPSFPSGHSAGYFASAAALSICFPALTPLFMTVAALGAYSRIYCGVHFPSDVLAGSGIGLLFGWTLGPFLYRALG
jgi:undecaprenyl-diphosphatase